MIFENKKDITKSAKEYLEDLHQEHISSWVLEIFVEGAIWMKKIMITKS